MIVRPQNKGHGCVSLNLNISHQSALCFSASLLLCKPSLDVLRQETKKKKSAKGATRKRTEEHSGVYSPSLSDFFSQKPVSSSNYLPPSSIYWLRLGCLEAIKKLIVEISEDWVFQ